jgi:hypothetical protein
VPFPIDYRLMVHRLNLPYSIDRGSANVIELVGSKSGVSILDTATKAITVPLGSSAEVDLWVFGNGKTVVTHHNPNLSMIDRYPTLELFLEAWGIKRSFESQAGKPHGIILANIKTHGGEEGLLERFSALGIPNDEVVLLDQEGPATDRILRERRFGNVAPLAIRLSRIEPLSGVLAILEQQDTFSVPFGVFLDPFGFDPAKSTSILPREQVERMYDLAPHLEFIVCCPSRWGQTSYIDPLAEALLQAGVRQPLVMTDIPLFVQWRSHLQHWPARQGRIHSAA